MPRTLLVLLLAIGCAGIRAEEVATVKVYVDTDVCAHLLIGSIDNARINCSKSTFKDGSDPALVRLKDNLVFEVNKPKMVKDLVGQLAEATGELKVKDNRIKLQSINPIQADSIPAGDPARALLDVRTYKAPNAPKTYEKVRHELAMLPYITEYDFISFAVQGDTVILTGWTVRQTNRNDAQGVVKNIEGVSSVINNIEVLPLGSFDMSIRANARAKLQRVLARYFWGNGSDIKIIVKNGTIVLLGSVLTKADSDLAYMQCMSVPSAFKVINLLRVQQPPKEKKG